MWEYPNDAQLRWLITLLEPGVIYYLMNGYAKTGSDQHYLSRRCTAWMWGSSVPRDMVLLGKALIHDVPEEYAIHKEKEFTFNKIFVSLL